MPRGKRIDGKKSAPRSTKAEVQYRKNKLFNLIRTGATAIDCVRYADKEWGLTEGTTRKLLIEVRADLRRDFEVERQQFAAELMQQCASIQMEARRTGNLNAALGAVNTLAKLGQVMA